MPDPRPALVYLEASEARVVRVQANGGGRQVLYDGTDAATLAPAPAPDGDSILFGTEAGGVVSWQVVPVGGGPPTPFAAPPGVNSHAGLPTETHRLVQQHGVGSIGISSPGSTDLIAPARPPTGP